MAQPCGAPVEDEEWPDGYEWEPGEYWCEYHIALDTVGRACLGCGRVLTRVEDAEDWYIDNGGQLCGECNRPRPTAELTADIEGRNGQGEQ
jgi:hypothetical protein